MQNLPTINTIDVLGKNVLVRVDFNVPIEDGQITDLTRIKAAVPTIKRLLKLNASVILMSHLGRPKTTNDPNCSLKQLVPAISDLIDTKVKFVSDCVGPAAKKAVAKLKLGEVLLLENTRFYKEETKGDKDFAEQLSELGDIYVNDAFGTAHRAHASTAVIAQFFPEGLKAFGLLMEKEIRNAEKVLNQCEPPFTAILGGAKVSDKIPIIQNLLSRANNIIIGGAMAYTFFKAMGGEVGNSLVEDDKMLMVRALMGQAELKNVRIILPKDSVVASKFADDAETQLSDNNMIPDNWMGLDIGPTAIKDFSKVIKESKTILWNGPMGVFEMEPFQNGTKEIALAVSEATKQGAFSLIGGGDSVAAINQFKLSRKVSYISTGGGALLEYFEGQELPGIAAILND